MKRVWLIEIEDPKGKSIWRKEVPWARFTQTRMTDLLRLFTARAELDFDAIFNAADTKGPATDGGLDVRYSFAMKRLSSGIDWSITARMMLRDSDGTLRNPPYPHM